MVEGGALERWFALEMMRTQRSFVPRPRPLFELIEEADPKAETKGGEWHRFDPETLRRIHQTLSPLARRKLRVPLTFFVDKDMADDAHLADEAGIEMLRALGEVPADLQPREGRLWLGHARARLLSARYPGIFQFVHA